jgi:hypothetical protein
MIRFMLVLVGLASGLAPAAAGPIFSGVLSGSQEVPPVVTPASGFGFVDFSDDLQSARVFLQVSNIENIWMAHIHVGAAGTNGPVVLDFFGQLNPPQSTIDVPGTAVLYDQIVTAANIIPRPAQGINNFADFLNAARAGNLYFNVHTHASPPNFVTPGRPGNFPGGEVRGQLALGVPEPVSLVVFGVAAAAGVGAWRWRKAG